MNTALRLEGLALGHDGHPLLSGVSLSLEQGELACLLGPSGCGKTTLLRAIAGFQTPLAGEIHIGGRRVSAPGWALPTEQRRVGMLFQDFALFPHLSVAANILFGIAGMPRRRQRLDELLELTDLTALRDALPHTLSGGQQQRVALARAMAPRPDVLLLDEPFSSLDVRLREPLAREVRAILQHEGVTSVLVSHDQLEAFALADRIGILHDGRMQQWDTAYALYHRPATRWVAGFIGEGVLLGGRVTERDRVHTELAILHGQLPGNLPPGTAVDVLIRPDDVLHDDHSPHQAVVLSKTFRGAQFLYTLELPGGGRVLSLVPSHHDHPVGSAIGIRLELDELVVFPRD